MPEKIKKRLSPTRWTLRGRLLLTIGSILVLFQLISVFWLWHESKEQIQLLVESAIYKHNNHAHIEREVHEAVASLLVPSLFIIGMALLICMQAVKLITRPLRDLQRELEIRTSDNLQPIVLNNPSAEVEAVSSAINQLVARLNLTLDRERLFTADVAHELRTPLAGLRLHLELLAKSHPSVDVSRLILRIDQMTESVSQLLQLARMAQSFSAGSYQQVMLIRDVMLPLQDELQTMLGTHQQTLVLPEDQEDVAVRGDAVQLRVLLRNLVENAHRYSPEKSVITLKLEQTPAPVLAVEDEGPGVDEAKSKELSKAFVRMDSRYGGIGLGLSIVSRIAQLHDAQFYLHNRTSRPGVRAWVQFPPVV
ncbi:two-component system sensor histidine kinase PmrB [Enterobacter sp. C2]|uniref:two-component system sensor histidine kinase PmrB n=1 Tax=Enterobacter sp. C2 TaxID=2870346 RepID=UPI001CA4519A|nr:two-component system sensor histidine kinase PmrB [Enterobacter sp. C2]